MFSAICFLLSCYFWFLCFKYWGHYREIKREEAKYK